MQIETLEAMTLIWGKRFCVVKDREDEWESWRRQRVMEKRGDAGGGNA